MTKILSAFFLTWENLVPCSTTTTVRPRLIVGGSAVPEALIRSYRELGVEIIHAWGMTETYDSAIATYIKSYLRGSSEDEVRLRKKQGLPFPCIEVDLIDETGRRLP
jgi:fatty-acyl-CoA synthase